MTGRRLAPAPCRFGRAAGLLNYKTPLVPKRRNERGLGLTENRVRSLGVQPHRLGRTTRREMMLETARLDQYLSPMRLPQPQRRLRSVVPAYVASAFRIDAAYQCRRSHSDNTSPGSRRFFPKLTANPMEQGLICSSGHNCREHHCRHRRRNRTVTDCLGPFNYHTGRLFHHGRHRTGSDCQLGGNCHKRHRMSRRHYSFGHWVLGRNCRKRRRIHRHQHSPDSNWNPPYNCHTRRRCRRHLDRTAVPQLRLHR